MVFFSVNSLSKQNRTMRLCIKNLHSLKVRLFAVLFIDLNEYLDSFPGATMDEKMGITELNEILLNIN